MKKIVYRLRLLLAAVLATGAAILWVAHDLVQPPPLFDDRDQHPHA